MSVRIQRVSPFFCTSQFAYSEDFDFRIWSSPGFLMQLMIALMEPDSFFTWFFLCSFRHHFGAACWAENADVEQMEKVVPLITCEIPFCQYVCKLMFGIDIPNLNLGIQIYPIKQPIKSNSVGSRHMSHCWTPAFDYHLNHGFMVLRDVQHCTKTRKLYVRWHTVTIIQIKIVVLGLEPWFGFACACLMWCYATGFPIPPDLWCCWVGFGKKWNTSMTKFQRSRAGIPSMRKPASREIISASVELCETEICFLHIQLVDPNVWLPAMHKIHLMLILSLPSP